MTPASGPAPAAPPAGPLLLIVEDNPANLLLAQAALQRGGFRTTAARSADDALAQLDTARPDAILMDLQLPGMDGLALTRRLKQDPATAVIPVIALTAHAMAEDRARAFAAGCAGFLTKPIDPLALPEQVAALLGAPDRGDQPTGHAPAAAPAASAPINEGERVLDWPTRETPARTDRSRVTTASTATPGSPGAPAARVLVIDDHAANVDLIRAQLAGAGYAVDTASGGEAGLAAALAIRPDVILLDAMMPGLDGFEVVRRLKAGEETRAIPVIMLTALHGPEDRLRGLDAGADDFLSKPADSAELLARVRALVRSRGLYEALATSREQLARVEAELAAQNHTAAAIQQNEARFRLLFAANPQPMWVYDLETLCFTEVNAAAVQKYGYSREEFLQLRLTDIRPQEDVPQLMRHLSAQRPTTQRGEWRHRLRDGTLIDVEITSHTLELDGRPAALVVARDITERKRAQADVLAANERLREALDALAATQQQIVQQERLKALGEMASGIAHDFNNALSPVLGFSDLLMTQPESLRDTEKVRRYLALIHTGASDAAEVVRRLREFYRSPEETEELGAVELPSLVRQAIDLTQPRWKDQAQAEGRTVVVHDRCEDTPPVQGAEAALREALMNLIFNAVDAMPGGGAITLATRWEPDTGLVALEVTDTGTGMDEATRLRCLEPFFTTKGEKGTGLGLAMVYGIVQRFGGTIDIASTPGAGTTFALRFPVFTEGESLTGDAYGGDPAAALRPLRIYVVDDDPRAGTVAEQLLLADGHAVVPARTGAEALERYAGEPPGTVDVVISDQAMPGMSGAQLAAALRARGFAGLILLASGFGDLMRHRSERPAGVDAVLGKPLTVAALREALRRHATRAKAGETPGWRPDPESDR